MEHLENKLLNQETTTCVCRWISEYKIYKGNIGKSLNMYFYKYKTETSPAWENNYIENKINFVTHALHIKNAYWLETLYNWFTKSVCPYILVNLIMMYCGHVVS